MQSTNSDREFWVQEWDRRAIGFHNDFIHPMLQKHVELMEGGRGGLTVLVPLCGKSLDMKWLADRGHTVIGVEGAQTAVEEFFEEQKISFTSAPVEAVEGTLYQSEDKQIKIYCCDFFKISLAVVGPVDAVWDRGSMEAISVTDRARYAAVMQSLLAPNYRYLLAGNEYDTSKFAGPPHHLSNDAVREAFGEGSTVTEVDCRDAFEPWQKERWGIDWLKEKTFLITQKQ